MADIPLGDGGAVELAVETAERMTGVVVPRYRWPILSAELARQGAASELRKECLQRLLTSTPLVDLVTIPESYLFRHEKHFRLLRQVAERLRDAGRPCTVLCAGCATGEEAWSAAAVLASVSPPSGTRHRVVGWEISPARIERARQGRYGAWARRKGLLEYEEYFHRDGEEVVATDALRSMVSFAAVNLVRDPIPDGCRPDVILFRNVSIYWREDTVAEVCRKLASIVSRDGVILVGPSDPTVFPAEWQQRLCGGMRSFWHRHVPCPGECELSPNSSIKPGRKPACKRQRMVSADRQEANRRPVEPAARKPKKSPASPVVSPKPVHTVGRTQPPTEFPSPIEERDILEDVAALADEARYGEALDLLVGSDEVDRVEGKLWRGILLLSLDRNKEALRMFRQCVFLRPDVAEHHHWLAMAYDALGQHRLAERHRRNACQWEV